MSFLVPKVCPVCGVKHLWDEVEELEEWYIMIEDEERGIEVYDNGDGIALEIPMLMSGASIRLYLTDECAQGLVNTIQNKLNARLWIWIKKKKSV